MNYVMYCALYSALDGKTWHYYDGTLGCWDKDFLSPAEFDKKYTRLLELESRDDENVEECMRYNESDMYEMADLRSDLFVIEYERYNRIRDALGENDPLNRLVYTLRQVREVAPLGALDLIDDALKEVGD